MCVERAGPEPLAYYYFRSAIFSKCEKLPFLTNFGILWGANPKTEPLHTGNVYGPGRPLSYEILKTGIVHTVFELLGGTHP